MKQRHYVQAQIGLAQFQANLIVMGHRADIHVRQWHNLRGGSCSRSMKNQRDVFCFSETCLRRSLPGNRVERKCSCRGRRIGNEIDNDQAELVSQVAEVRLIAGFYNNRFGAKTRQIKPELIDTISGIKWNNRAARADSHEGDRHLGTVIQHDDDSIIAANPELIQRFFNRFYLQAQLSISQRQTSGR